MSQQLWWYATRSAGLLTWVAATSSVVLGLLLASRALGRRPSAPWLLDLHRYVGGLTMVFLAIHLVTLWADSYVHFGWAELFVPGASAWRPGAVAWGVVAAWLLAAVELTSLLRDRLPRRLWHGIHLLSFPVAIMGTVHAWQAGSDVRNLLVLAIGGVMGVGIVGLTGQRLRLRARSAQAGRDRKAALAAVRQRHERPELVAVPPPPAPAPRPAGPAPAPVPLVGGGPPPASPGPTPVPAPARPAAPVGASPGHEPMLRRLRPAPAPTGPRPLVARPAGPSPVGVPTGPRPLPRRPPVSAPAPTRHPVPAPDPGHDATAPVAPR